jgi:hypothetical protein
MYERLKVTKFAVLACALCKKNIHLISRNGGSMPYDPIPEKNIRSVRKIIPTFFMKYVFLKCAKLEYMG